MAYRTLITKREIPSSYLSISVVSIERNDRNVRELTLLRPDGTPYPRVDNLDLTWLKAFTYGHVSERTWLRYVSIMSRSSKRHGTEQFINDVFRTTNFKRYIPIWSPELLRFLATLDLAEATMVEYEVELSMRFVSIRIPYGGRIHEVVTHAITPLARMLETHRVNKVRMYLTRCAHRGNWGDPSKVLAKSSVDEMVFNKWAIDFNHLALLDNVGGLSILRSIINNVDHNPIMGSTLLRRYDNVTWDSLHVEPPAYEMPPLYAEVDPDEFMRLINLHVPASYRTFFWTSWGSVHRTLESRRMVESTIDEDVADLISIYSPAEYSALELERELLRRKMLDKEALAKDYGALALFKAYSKVKEILEKLVGAIDFESFRPRQLQRRIFNITRWRYQNHMWAAAHLVNPIQNYFMGCMMWWLYTMAWILTPKAALQRFRYCVNLQVPQRVFEISEAMQA